MTCQAFFGRLISRGPLTCASTTRLASLGRLSSHGRLIYAWTTCQAPWGCVKRSRLYSAWTTSQAPLGRLISHGHLMTVRPTRTSGLAQSTSYLIDAWMARHWTVVHTTRLALLVSRLISA